VDLSANEIGVLSERLADVEEQLSRIAQSRAADALRDANQATDWFLEKLRSLRDSLRDKLGEASAKAEPFVAYAGAPPVQSGNVPPLSRSPERAAELLMRAATALQRSADTMQGKADRESLEQEKKEPAAKDGRAQAGWSAAVSLAAGIGVTGAVASADPFSAFPTFRASMELLAAEIGQRFIPIMEALSAAAQKTVKFLERLSPAWNDVITAVGATAIGIGALALAIKTGTGVYTVATGFVSLFRGSIATATVAKGAETIAVNAATASMGSMTIAADAAAIALWGVAGASAAKGVATGAGAAAKGVATGAGAGAAGAAGAAGGAAATAATITGIVLSALALGAGLGRNIRTRKEMGEWLTPAQLKEKYGEEAVKKSYLKGLEEQLKMNEEHAKKTGKPMDAKKREFYETEIAGAKEALKTDEEKKKDIMRDYRGPEPVVSDFVSYNRRFTASALKSSELRDEILKKQLEHLEKSNQLLKEIAETAKTPAARPWRY
jgi:disulfide oxidoreductase YuzD